MVSKFIPFISGLRAKIGRDLNNSFQRDEFVRAQLAAIEPGSKILDAGCGTQRYRPACAHLDYRSQDFAQYVTDEQRTLLGSPADFVYGNLDYVGDIWNIAEADASFDAVLCTEVFEHIPFPIETLREFGRLLKPGGKLIVTAPSNCLRHMDPYYFYAGFSDRWYERMLPEAGFRLVSIDPVGDYYRWLAVEAARTAMSHSMIAKVLLAPAFFYYYGKQRTRESFSTLCMGYHVVATRV